MSIEVAGENRAAAVGVAHEQNTTMTRSHDSYRAAILHISYHPFGPGGDYSSFIPTGAPCPKNPLTFTPQTFYEVAGRSPQELNGNQVAANTRLFVGRLIAIAASPLMQHVRAYRDCDASASPDSTDEIRTLCPATIRRHREWTEQERLRREKTRTPRCPRQTARRPRTPSRSMAPRPPPTPVHSSSSPRSPRPTHPSPSPDEGALKKFLLCLTDFDGRLHPKLTTLGGSALENSDGEDDDD
jgi:hypothetical protein